MAAGRARVARAEATSLLRFQIGFSRTAGPDAAGSGRAGGVVEGTPTKGAVNVVGTHFSKGRRTSFDGRFNWVGLKGKRFIPLLEPEYQLLSLRKNTFLTHRAALRTHLQCISALMLNHNREYSEFLTACSIVCRALLTACRFNLAEVHV